MLVVDVEDRDDSAYREVTPIHGGVSGLANVVGPPLPLRAAAVRFASQSASNRGLPWLCFVRRELYLVQKRHSLDGF